MKKIVLIAFVLFKLDSEAQTNLGMSQYTPAGLVDTVTAGTSSSYSVWVINHGPVAFNDTLQVYTSVLDSINTNGFLVDVYSTPSAISILPNDSVQISLTALYNLSPTGYKAGIDVIVVWPVAATANTVDSLMFNVWIIDPSGVNEIDLERFINVYPNPTTENITIGTQKNVSVEEVKIVDIAGKLVFECKNETILNVKDLAPGVYYINVQLSTKKHITGKIIKQNKHPE